MSILSKVRDSSGRVVVRITTVFNEDRYVTVVAIEAFHPNARAMALGADPEFDVAAFVHWSRADALEFHCGARKGLVPTDGTWDGPEYLDNL